jgi:protein-disulfide isomerase
MMSRETARKSFAAVALVFVATMATLACRQFNLVPDRPSPAFRGFGPPAARIQIYEYTDFACPACGAAEEQVRAVLKLYPDSVRVNFKHYPLTGIHPWSFQAASYADCAGAQGKFMDYAGLLFGNQEKWAPAKEKPAQFTEYAKALSLDMPALEKCLQDPETARRVRMDVSEGDLKRVSATPTFFINGRMAVGGGQFLEAAKRFDNLLKKDVR